MRETITKNSIFFFAFVFSFVLMTNETKAQTGNLPTSAQLNAKLARIDSLSSFNASHQELYSIQELGKKQLQLTGRILSDQNPTNKNIIWQNKDNIPTKTHTGPAPLMTTGPEQNCASGIDVCGRYYTQVNSYTGHGTIQEVPATTCLLTQETNSVWYIFTCQSPGTFGFKLNTLNDYDFALYNITANGCAGVPTSTPVRCNFSASPGLTGMDTTVLGSASELPASSINQSGSPISPGINNMVAGQTYALIIDNFSANTNGYTLEFTGTASIHDVTPPTITSIVNNCNNSVTLTFSEAITCSSIQTTANYDFTISGGMTINSEAGIGCSASSNLTNQITLGISGSATSGSYTITAQNGTDGNTVLDKCGNALAVGANISFNYLAPVAATVSPISATVCSGSSATITTSGGTGAATYAWTPSGGSGSAATVTPTATTTYQCAITYGGCTRIVSSNITVIPLPIVTISPINAVLCSGGTTVLTATVTGGTGPFTYLWSGTYGGAGTGTGTTNVTPAEGAGTYTVTASTSSPTCTSLATSTTISVATPPANYCSIYYVTPTGTGDGTTIALAAGPTTMAAMLNTIACGGATVKMAIGVYPMTTKLIVKSNVTVEGGFNTTFTTKTSDMSGGTSSTTLRRSNTADVGSPTTVTCFDVFPGASNFRFQDLRIEMPGAAPLASNPVNSAGSGIINYAINLGAGCSSYNIVRCYVDAGSGGTGASGVVSKTYTGSNQTWNVPAGISSINVQLWGAGGGGGRADATHLNSGGSGGYVAGTLSVTPSSTLTIIVGRGGNEAPTGSASYGGGGNLGSNSYYCSSGGGRSSIQKTAGTDDVTAGGGGGAGTASYNTSNVATNGNAFGGAGGSTTAGSSNAVSDVTSATGGTQASGGSGGVGTNSWGSGGGTATGSSGSQYIGGDGSTPANGSNGSGGGGGGYYGGGGGGCGHTSSNVVQSNGGGGGSSYLGTLTGTTNTIGNTNNAGSVAVSPNNIDANYVAGVGQGGAGGTASTGGNGLVVITYNNSPGTVYGIYAPASQTGATITDCEITAASGCANCNPTSAAYVSATISSYPLIVAGATPNWNTNCTGKNMTMTTAASSPSWIFGAPTSDGTGGGAGASMITQYPTTGRKSVKMTSGSAYTYTDFNNMITAAPASGSLLASITSGCPGVYSFASSLGNAPGYTFAWAVWGAADGVTLLPGGVTATIPIGTVNTNATNITLTNTTGANQTVYVQLIVSSECCGTLATYYQAFIVDAIPATPTVSASPSINICLGSCTTLTGASTTSGSSFEWYNALTGGSLLYSGANYSVCPAATTTYWVQSVGTGGCASAARQPVTVTVTQTPAPTVNAFTQPCSAANVTLSISSPTAGATYNWYSGSCNGVLLGSGTSITTFVSANMNIYVNVTVSGCNTSLCTTIAITLSGNPTLVTWNGAHSSGNNNWFDNLNWTPNCLPTCGTDVIIPYVATSYPDIGFSATYGAAACKTFTLNAPSTTTPTLSFSDAKAELDVCGDFNQFGTITTYNKGKIVFMGTATQNFTCSSSASGDLNDVVLNNTASTPLLVIKEVAAPNNKDMNISSLGSFSFQSGIVQTDGARCLNIKNTTSSSLSGGSLNGYVWGRLKRSVGLGAYDFPVGASPIGAASYPYELLHINLTALSGLTDLTVKFENPTSNAVIANIENSDGTLPAAAPYLPLNGGAEGLYDHILNCGGSGATSGINISGVDKAGIWIVLPNSAAVTPTYDLALYGRNFSNAITGVGWSVIKRDTYASCSTADNWTLNSPSAPSMNSYAGNMVTASRNGMTGFSHFAIARTPVVLPIELVAFDVMCTKESAKISWATASETNNNHFTLERSCDNMNSFASIATITGAGNSSSLKQYSFIDTDFPGAICYYRLTQTDNDGTTKYFNIVAANCSINSNFNLNSIVPNPTTSDLSVLFTNNVNESVFITVTDLLGQEFYKKEILCEKGLNTITLDMSNYSEGVYFLRVNNGKKSFIKKVVKN